MFHDVVVQPDGSITIVPGPIAFLGGAFGGALLRRRRLGPDGVKRVVNGVVLDPFKLL